MFGTDFTACVGERVGQNGPVMFSIILCTYNRADVLPDAIDGALRQTWKDFELRVVDDGSDDGTFDVVDRYRQRDSRVHYQRHEVNRGLPAARNTGLETATREWVTFLDSDDTYRPEHLELRARSIREHPEVDLIHSPATVLGPDWVPDLHDPGRRISLDECRLGGTFFIRRDRALGLGGFPAVAYGDDSIFFDRAEAAGFRIRWLDARTYVYNRLRDDAITRQMEDRRNRSITPGARR